jgi:hypothetical protein
VFWFIDIKESANFSTAVVLLKVAVVCMFVTIATAFLASHSREPNHWNPFIPANTGERGISAGLAISAVGVSYFLHISASMLYQPLRKTGDAAALEDARRLVEGYVEHYNKVRLNCATGYLTPKDVLAGRQQEIHAERDREAGSRQTATPESPPASRMKSEVAHGPRCRDSREVDKFGFADHTPGALTLNVPRRRG